MHLLQARNDVTWQPPTPQEYTMDPFIEAMDDFFHDKPDQNKVCCHLPLITSPHLVMNAAIPTLRATPLHVTPSRCMLTMLTMPSVERLRSLTMLTMLCDARPGFTSTPQL
jgi:hypothetical protein